ncbi:hypothetical protein L1I79_17295 [Strepomyces sp. STD 3.1]|uniref:hypothetical protein n=1 Tax=Streptomyces sp. NPDC058985 TaxID=3346684 RepID=UPI001F282223|nr:hypothetical protein [Streptomyces sp. STD 3.1]
MDDRSALSVPARKLLKLSTPRNPAQLAAFINLRVPARAPALAARHRGCGHPLSLPCSRMSGSGEIVQDRISADRRRDELEAAVATNFT